MDKLTWLDHSAYYCRALDTSGLESSFELVGFITWTRHHGWRAVPSTYLSQHGYPDVSVPVEADARVHIERIATLAEIAGVLPRRSTY